ncbi:hypothetical protein VYU27_010408, partial [Nannochloropsis oceanica]
KDMIVELLPMVIGQRSEYTSSFIAFLNETKKPEEMITADQWNQFYDFSLTYPTLEQLFKGRLSKQEEFRREGEALLRPLRGKEGEDEGREEGAPRASRP